MVEESRASVGDSRSMMSVRRLGDLGKDSIGFLILAIIVQIMFLLPEDDIHRIVRRCSDGALVTCFVFLAGFLAVIGQALLSSASGEQVDLERAYLKAKTILHVIIFVFFSLVVLWVFYLGGLLRSPFASLLATAPVYFVFLAMRSGGEDPALDEVASDRWSRAERVTGIFVVFSYMIAIFMVEVWLRGLLDEWLGIDPSYWDFIQEIHLVAGPDELAEYQRASWFRWLGYIVFYGSVACTAYTYWRSRRH